MDYYQAAFDITGDEDFSQMIAEDMEEREFLESEPTD